MGLDLRILPQYAIGADFSHDILECDGDTEMFDFIKNVEKRNGRKVPRNGINSFSGTGEDGEHCYGQTIQTAYGEDMISVQAGELSDALIDYQSESWRNRAVISFIKELPKELEVFLYWH